ncbi:hypothetical protein PF005_g17383 [Phytophthora fragariae]|uniref:Uncharacterized protein n=1 Tax=Phytophthora fragariae TaxID=53985 RepID=A0A6A3X361_9STRA|nr:hypothetical protein PF005_g17383 [Phytophthora fragariae]
MGKLIQPSGDLGHLSGDLIALLTDLVPLLTEPVPFLTDLSNHNYLGLVVGYPRLHMLETLHGVVTILDQAVTLNVEFPTSLLGVLKRIFRLSMMTADRV